MLKRLLLAVLLLCACAAEAAVYSLPWGPKPQFVDANGAPMSGGSISTYQAGSSTPQVTYTTQVGNVANATTITLNVRGETPNEVWLTGGLTYKLVLKDSSGATVWTVDNVSGVNDPTATVQDEWKASGLVPTYVSATSFTFSGDQTVAFQIGRRIKTTNSGGTVYSTISNSVYAPNTTTITVINDSGTLDSGLSAVSYALLARANASLPAFRSGEPSAASTGTTPRQIADKLGDLVNVKDFGAKCDSVTDDTAAITAAIAALPAGTGSASPRDGGGELHLPRGFCLITSQIDLSVVKNLTVSGEGKQASGFLVSGASALGGGAYFGALKLASDTSQSYKKLRDFSVRRASVPLAAIANDNGIVFGPTTGMIVIDSVAVLNMGNSALVIQQATSETVVRNSNFSDIRYNYAIQIGTAGAAGDQVIIDGNDLHNNDGGIYVGNSVGVVISNNDIEGYWTGGATGPSKPLLNLDTNGNNVIVTGNSFGFPTPAQGTVTASEIIKIAGQANLFIGNTFAQGTTNIHAVHLLNGALVNTFIANTASAAVAGGGTGNAYKVDAGSSNTQIMNPIYGNTWVTKVNDAGTQTLVTLGSTVTAGVLDLTGILSATVSAGAGVYVKRSGGGDMLRVTPLAAGSGASIDVVKSDESDYKLLSMFGDGVTLQCRTGAGTTAACVTATSSGVILRTLTNATLGTPANGNMAYCSDCTIANPCAGAGTGALAKRLNGAWVCN